MRERASGFSNGGEPGSPVPVEPNRRVILRKLGALSGLTFIGGPSLVLGGCGGGGEDGSAVPPPIGVPPSPSPSVGAHGLEYLELNDNVNTVSVDLAATQASGSTILVCVGRGLGSNLSGNQHAVPTDNAGNAPYVQQDTAHAYTLWPDAGTALYAFQGATGRASHQVSVANLPLIDDEVTLAVVEVKNGRRIQEVSWVERLAAPLTSATVTTTGPATLVAFWWGDGNVNLHTAVPEAGFTALDSLLIDALIVQCAVAVKDVNMAGIYDVTWTATPLQGAQLWLVAVE